MARRLVDTSKPTRDTTSRFTRQGSQGARKQPAVANPQKPGLNDGVVMPDQSHTGVKPVPRASHTGFHKPVDTMLGPKRQVANPQKPGPNKRPRGL